MIEIQPIERVDMAQRIDQVRRRITEIEEKIGIGNGDFQAKLEREIARQMAINPVQPTQSVQPVKPAQKPTEAPKLPGETQPVNANEAANAAKIAQALRDADRSNPNQSPQSPTESQRSDNVAPDRVNSQQQNPPTINRIDIPDVEPNVPSRDEQIPDNNYIGRNADITPTEDLIMQTAYEYGVDPRLVRAIAIAESDMNQSEISPAGAIGVMQLMPETAASLGVDPYDRAENIVGGTRYIRNMLDTFDGNVPLAVAAYNAGPGAVKRYGGIPPYSETRNYVGRVMDLFQ